MSYPAVKFKLLRPGSMLPRRGTETSGAFDIFAPEAGTLHPGQRGMIPTGLAHEVCEGYTVPVYAPDSPNATSGALYNHHHKEMIPFTLQGLLMPRSGLASKKGIRLFFAPCLIDADYRGELGIMLENMSDEPLHWEQGDRLVQIAYVPMYMGPAEVAEDLKPTARGTGGFGSTGTGRL